MKERKKKEQHSSEELFVGFARVVVISVRCGIKRQCNRSGEKKTWEQPQQRQNQQKPTSKKSPHLLSCGVCIHTLRTFKRPFSFSFVELFSSFFASLFDALKYFLCCNPMAVFFIHFYQSNCTQCSISWKKPSMCQRASQPASEEEGNWSQMCKRKISEITWVWRVHLALAKPCECVCVCASGCIKMPWPSLLF